MSIRVDSTQSGQVNLRPCCHYADEFKSDSLEQYLSSTRLAELQQHMLTQDHLPPGCEFCAKQERLGLVSTRQSSLVDIDHQPTQTKISALEIFPSSICNLACVMCSPFISSRVAQEQKALGWIDNYQLINIEDAVVNIMQQCSDLDTVGFVGGEFFLTKRNIDILDIIAKRNIRAKVITNATVITPQHIERLMKIDDLDITISIDGIMDHYELIRYPAIWSDVERNIQTLIATLPQAKIHFNCVVQPLNLLGCIDLLDYSNRLLRQIHLCNLERPEWLTWPILTVDEKTRMLAKIDQQMRSARLLSQQRQQLASLMDLVRRTEHQPKLRQQFNDRFGSLIAHRGLDTTAIQQLSGINLQT